MITCIKCMVDKPDTEFYPKKKTNSTFRTCKECMRQKQREYLPTTDFPPAKTYEDYLKEQNMFDYYKKVIKLYT